VTDAPDSGENADGQTSPADDKSVPDQAGDKPAEGTAPDQSQEPPKPPNIPYDELPDNMRAELRRANLAPEVKEALAQAWYERKAFHDVGFTVDQARQLKNVGFTPEAANDRLRLHPTVDDAVTDANLANLARTLIEDFQTNPANMLDGLSNNAPEAFPQFAEAVASRLRSDAPQVYGSLVSKAMLNALRVLESEFPPDDFESREKISFVRDRWFPKDTGEGQKQPGAFDPNDPIHQRYAKLQEQEQQRYQTQATNFTEAVKGYGEQTILAEISNRVSGAMPKGTDPSVVQRASGEILNLVARDFFGNRGVVSSLDQMIRQSDLSQDALNQIVTSIYNRAVPLIAVHARPVLEFWSKNLKTAEQPVTPAVTSQPHSATSSRTVANAPSAAKVAAASPPVGQPTHPPKEFIAAGRSKGWDTVKILGEWISGQR
jgi:hypothetical protein